MRFGGFWAFWANDDPDAERGSGVDRDGPHQHVSRHAGLALQVQEQLKRDPHCGDLYIFRGRKGDLAKILWHDGLGLSLYAKRLDRGKFIWPSAKGASCRSRRRRWPTCWKESTGGIRN